MQKNELLEIYKLHVNMADCVSERRGQANRFYITLLSSLLAVLAFTVENLGTANLASNIDFIIFLVGLLGILLCIIWHVNIKSYRQLNSGKFKVLHELEAKLSFPFYKREWELLGKGESMKKYRQLSKIESFTPFIIMIPFLLILAYSIKNILN